MTEAAPLIVACVWVGERYSADYPAILQSMVRRNLSPAYAPRFVCITDRPSELPDGMEAIDPEPGLPGWWQKVALFKPGKLPLGRILYLDLDVAITGEMDALAARPGIIRDWHMPTYNSSVMVWDAGDHAEVWRRFTRADMDRLHGDQDLLTEVGGWEEFPRDWCVSYRSHAPVWPAAGAKVVCFHGEPKPHAISDGWVPLVWREDGARGLSGEGGVNVTYEQLMENMRAAVQRDRPVFTGQPPHGRECCIVGSAPSVAGFASEIKARQDDGAAVISMNGSLRWLLEHGITPSSHVLLDARPENVVFARDVPHETAVFVASQCHPDVFDALADHPRVVLWHACLNSRDLAEQTAIVEREDGAPVMLVGGGSTVGLRAMILAHLSGFHVIHLYGMDSSYSGERHHAFTQDVLNENERPISVMMAGKSYVCSPWMAWQAQQFNHQHDAVWRAGVTVVAHGYGLLPDICRILSEEKAKGSHAGVVQRSTPLLDRLPDGPCEMVEVGVSAALMSQHLLESRPDMIWHGVDSWLGVQSQPESYRATGDSHALQGQHAAEYRRHVALEHLQPFGDRARVYHMDSRAAAERVPAASMDLVFLDGDHSHEGVSADIAAWWPKVKPGGWLGGHDYANPDDRFKFGVESAVHEWADRERLPVTVAAGLTWWTQKELS